ncbi:MAG: leucine-rich repeat domain-containing protein, partial [Bacteroidales bacterium]|nr:leucine-rich repeat domain-containing protein [Bacteroidales bacterium]
DFFNVTIGNNVTSIGSYSFYGCKGLTEFSIPQSVTSIGNDAFTGCTSIKKVIFEDGTSSLSLGYKRNSDNSSYYYGLFKDCPIESLYLGRNLSYSTHSYNSSYPGYGSPFENLSNVFNVTIGNNVTSIGSYAFYRCKGLKSISISNNVISIGNSAFSGCTGLTSINIPTSVTSIEGYAFYGCAGVTNITFPNSLTSIGHGTFYGCTGLTYISIPNKVTSIGDAAFEGCTNLKKVYNFSNLAIKKGNAGNGYVAYYTDYLYNNCQWDGDYIVTIDDSMKYVCGYKGTETHLVLPDVDGISEGAFYDYPALTNVTLPNGLTFISSSAFDGCCELQYNEYDNAQYLGNEENPLLFLIKSKDKDISSCEIDKDCKYIAEKAFFESIGLKSLTIPSQVKGINNCAFLGCTNLKTLYNYSELSFTKGSTSHGYVAYYADYVYNNCQTGGDYIYTIADGKKYICKYIGTKTEIILPEVDGICDYAFSNCPNLNNITIPNSVTKIAPNAFYGCTSLKYNEHDNALYLGNEENPYLALIKAKNTSIASCFVHKNCQCVADDAFKNCNDLKKVFNFSDLSINKGSNSYGYIGYYADFVYNHCKMEGDYVFSGKNDKEYICGYVGNDTELILPEVDGIDDGAFKNSMMKEVNIPSSITSIGYNAFQGCKNLYYFIIPENIESIGNEAFIYCNNLKRVYNCSTLTLRSNSSYNGYVAYYASYVYNNCQKEGDYVLTTESDQKYVCGYVGKETELVLPEADGISNDAFNGCNALTCVSLPNSMKSIGSNAFYNCSELINVSLSENLTIIGSYAFYNCNKLQDFVLPDALTSIDDYAFYGCTKLTSITIPNDVNLIGDYAFRGCTGLTNVTINIGVTNIGKYAFYDCSGLTSISIPNSVTSIGNSAFTGCTGTLFLNCDTEDDESVADSWFYNSKFTEVVIGNEVTKIGKNAFYGLTSITRLTIGSNLNRIGYDAFNKCTGLKGIYSNALTPPHCRDTAFDEDTKWDCPLYVPATSIEEYKTAEVWKDFLAIKENPEYSGIECLTSVDKGAAPTLDLQGQLVSTPTKGKVYIQNGKKFLMK